MRLRPQAVLCGAVRYVFLARWCSLVVCLSACDCGGDLLVDGPHPYVRCVAAEVDDGAALGALSANIDGRVLTITGVQEAEVFAVSAVSTAWLSEAEPVTLQFVIGGFARDAATANAVLPAIAARGPAVLLPGGEDDTTVFDEALQDLPSETRAKLVDLRGVRRLQIGSHGFVVVPGAPLGRYGRGERPCGFGAADVALLADVAETGMGLLSWAAPLRVGTDPLDQGLLAQHVGDPMLAELVAEAGLSGGFHAWPREAAGAPSAGDALQAVVPVVGGLTVDAAGGRRLGVPLRVSFGSDGVRVRE